MHVTDLLNTVERDGVLHAVMQSPPRNAPDGPLLEALSDLVARFETGPARALVLSSALPSWFAGPVPANSASRSAEFISDGAVRNTLSRLMSCRKPSIAAIDGSTVGLGLELAMACTWRFCTQASRLSLPGVHDGALPSAGGTQRLPRLVGPSRALDLMLTGREIRGDEALRIGLADRLLYRGVVEEALVVASSISVAPTGAIELITGCVEAAMDLPPHLGASVERAALVSLIDGEY